MSTSLFGEVGSGKIWQHQFFDFHPMDVELTLASLALVAKTKADAISKVEKIVSPF